LSDEVYENKEQESAHDEKCLDWWGSSRHETEISPRFSFICSAAGARIFRDVSGD
jgi:hypothetical protein